ncbi:MAG: DNA translocase FtsK 4TM domain-containing protein, partial [Xanthomonadaceae bacterium]|nr:DNA translocase FtsK 4TM domain-containing protein [Xanthomonadaceae bacterium]
MTYSLDTLNSRNSPAAGAPGGFKRFAREVGLILGLVGLILWLAALLSYSPQDAAWSTSGNPEAASSTVVAARNWGGHLGAWVADASYFLLGFSVWWALVAGCWAWLRSVTRGLRGDSLSPEHSASRLQFWLSLLLLLAASAALEWSRLYRFEFRLPGHAGGVIGYVLGNLGVKWLGFAGSGLLLIALGVIAVAGVFNFSWARVALVLGARIDSVIALRREQREVAEDLAVGKKAAREREETLTGERIEIEEQHPVPVIIKPPAAEAPKSERAVKIRPQAPPVVPVAAPSVPSSPATPAAVLSPAPALKTTPAASIAPAASTLPSLSDSRLPQVSLLDTALLRQESVAAETLEMTSRLIEKKLKDFGVEVRVVAAAPGPVITRYEIEPATGVKGSQVVTLAKDLARALSLVSIRVIETIPGKNYMALELPNAKRQMIKLSEILGSQV